MRAGRLDRYVELQQLVKGRTPDGGEVESWTTFARPFAMVEHVAGSDQFQSDQRAARQSVRVEIRYRSGVTPRMRVVIDGDAFEISNVAELHRRTKLLLTCHAFEVES